MENKSTEVKMGKMPSKREARKSAREEQRSSSYDLTEPRAMINTAGATPQTKCQAGSIPLKKNGVNRKIKSRHAPIKH